MIPVREGGDQVLYGKDGREYRISYALGLKQPWLINGNLKRRYATLGDATSAAHEMEAQALGEDRWK